MDKITVFAGDVHKPTTEFSISRQCSVTIYSGIFSELFHAVLHPMVKTSKEKRKQFQNRSRSEQSDKKPKPLLVDFGRNVFEKTETIEGFSRILADYTNCNYSVMDKGDRHVYISVVDRNDNSSFAVRTFGMDSLLIIPQIKTSDLSLMRFSKFLVHRFTRG